MDGVCVGVVLQAWEPEPIVRERFFDGLLEAVCSSVVSDLSPVSVQTLVEQGFGGAEGSRTPDLVIANDALYQLSYGPVSSVGSGFTGVADIEGGGRGVNGLVRAIRAARKRPLSDRVRTR